MYSLKYKVTTSTCDSEGRLKLYSALQMMQDCSEMWIRLQEDDRRPDSWYSRVIHRLTTIPLRSWAWHQTW